MSWPKFLVLLLVPPTYLLVPPTYLLVSPTYLLGARAGVYSETWPWRGASSDKTGEEA